MAYGLVHEPFLTVEGAAKALQSSTVDATEALEMAAEPADADPVAICRQIAPALRRRPRAHRQFSSTAAALSHSVTVLRFRYGR
jgi:hypothetical protein